ncbi:hypothetical protein N6H18_00530 [Reichenbachiella agarivorans]|uniref:Anti-sigma factor n=1 Tax=Reichenbachiella agarivorans TaxID=2979464 RepID=A0ABY6CW25_9BACT|nr:hypothetical protein [Reichenbachiella agarivorans]UXP32460.1 hypothetical protein N6H18_00530 [Reichenbachiella agarivorans]
MKDNLEDFIRAHRDKFDDLEPKKGLWDAINENLDENQETKKPFQYIWIWKAAAVVFVCISLGLLIERNWTPKSSETVVVEDNPKEDIQEIENYYAGLIQERKAEILQVMSQSEVMDGELIADLDDLDRMYQELKIELSQNQNNEKVISAMIQNLQLRVEILNKQLKVLEQLLKYERDEKISV